MPALQVNASSCLSGAVWLQSSVSFFAHVVATAQGNNPPVVDLCLLLKVDTGLLSVVLTSA